MAKLCATVIRAPMQVFKPSLFVALAATGEQLPDHFQRQCAIQRLIGEERRADVLLGQVL